MTTLALNISMEGKRVVIVGGGAVATRKLERVMRSGAAVTVVAPSVSEKIAAMQQAGSCIVRKRCYHDSDLDGSFLVVAATDRPDVNRSVAEDALRRGVLVLVADHSPLGDCTFPATLQRGNLQIAVSTGGLSPTFALDVRDYIAGLVGDEFGEILETVAKEREQLLFEGKSGADCQRHLRGLAAKLIDRLAEGRES